MLCQHPRYAAGAFKSQWGSSFNQERGGAGWPLQRGPSSSRVCSKAAASWPRALAVSIITIMVTMMATVFVTIK
eukprot:4664343-Pyramimonas_sp.AAC.1